MNSDIRFVHRVAIAVCASLMLVQGAAGQQVVFLDFDTGNDANINYTPTMRNQIQQGIQEIYDDFNVVIEQTLPSAPFSRITFNEGFSGGVAEQIDFRNLDASDNALVNVTGFASGAAQVVAASITIGGHELGHLLGLRHGDSFGPIGTGLGTTGPSRTFYNPNYPGPAAGNEIVDHVMGTPAIGVNTTLGDHWLSERSATKLEFAESGTVINEAPGPKSTLATAQPITLDPLVVPNTIVSGVNAGPLDFSVDALSVVGNVSSGGEVDLYEFQAEAGDLFNIEVMSRIIDQRIPNTIDSELRVLNDQGIEIDYYGTPAFNDDEFESLDSILIDLVIPSDGTYFMQVNAFSSTDTGGYELFAYRFNGAVPEPASALLAFPLLLVMGHLRRRRG